MRGARKAALTAGFALLAAAARAQAGPPAAASMSLDEPAKADVIQEGDRVQARTPSPAPDQSTSSSATPQDPLAPVDEVPSSDAPSRDAWQVINWVIATHDNNDMPFMVIDKVAAKVLLFSSTGEKIAAAPALFGMTAGDESTPGVGDRELSNIPPKDRTTPAGRFVAKFGWAAGSRQVLWVDYQSAISIHPVITVRNQHRVERLNSPTPADNRITYGCINVPVSFYAKVIKPMFKRSAGIVYILPETKPLNEVFLAMPTPAEAPAATQKSE